MTRKKKVIEINKNFVEEAEKNKAKKKKKDPPFLVPEWAKEIVTLIEKVIVYFNS